MKRMVTLVMAFFLCLSFIACGNQTPDNTADSTASDASSTSPTSDFSEADDESTDLQPPVSTDGDDEMTVADALLSVIDLIYEKSPVELSVDTYTVDPSETDRVKSVTGLDDASMLEAIAVSEPMINAQAYSLVLVRVKDDADAETVKKAMIDGINPRKWVCVYADEVYALNSGKVVMLAMTYSEFKGNRAAELCDAFVEIFGSDNCGERIAKLDAGVGGNMVAPRVQANEIAE